MLCEINIRCVSLCLAPSVFFFTPYRERSPIQPNSNLHDPNQVKTKQYHLCLWAFQAGRWSLSAGGAHFPGRWLLGARTSLAAGCWPLAAGAGAGLSHFPAAGACAGVSHFPAELLGWAALTSRAALPSRAGWAWLGSLLTSVQPS